MVIALIPVSLVLECLGPVLHASPHSRYWYKRVTEIATSDNKIQNTIRNAKNNFTDTNIEGLSREDTRAILDVRSNPAWDNIPKLNKEIDRLAKKGTLDKVQQLEIITSDGTVTWP